MRTVSVTGNGKVEKKADRMCFNIRLSFTSWDNKEEVFRKTTELYDEVIRSIDEIGISRDDIVAEGCAANKSYDWQKKRHYFLGTASINVDTMDFEKASDLRSRFSDKEGANLGSINTYYNDYEGANKEALGLAFGDAFKNAQILAESAGMSVGKVAVMDASTARNNPSHQSMARMASAETLDSMLLSDSMPRESEYITRKPEFTAQVNVTFELIETENY